MHDIIWGRAVVVINFYPLMTECGNASQCQVVIATHAETLFSAPLPPYPFHLLLLPLLLRLRP